MKKLFDKGIGTPLLVGLLVVAAFLIGSLYTQVQLLKKTTPPQAAAPAAGQPAPSGPPAKVNMGVGHFPVKGNPNAKVTFVEFGDMRCPFCEQFFTKTEPQIMKDYVDTGKVKFAFRQYAFLGPASTVAANANECANEQNKFWDMYEYLYKNQPPESDTSMYTTANLAKAAGTLGMNTTQFSSCMDSNKYAKNISDDFTAGQQAGVTGTPAFFVNGTLIVGAQPYSNFKAAIDAELAATK